MATAVRTKALVQLHHTAPSVSPSPRGEGGVRGQDSSQTVIGHWSLVIGHWSLVIGHWSLVIGHWSFMPGFDILYEHGPVLVVNKPPGLLTQAPPGIDSLELRVKRFLKEREQKPGGVYLGVPHRLDRPVSGVIVLAKHVRAARRISEQFEAR